MSNKPNVNQLNLAPPETVPLVCVVIPACNVVQTLGSLLMQLKTLSLPVIVVDDGSTDGTGEVAAEAGVEIIRHNTNSGKGKSLRDGMQWGLGRGYTTFILMDGDGQHLPRDLKRLAAAVEDPSVGVAVGNRMRNLRSMPYIRRCTNWVMSLFISLLCRQRIPDSQCGFRAIRADLLQKIKLTTDRYEIETEMLVKAARAGFKIVSVPITTIYQNERSRIHPIADALRFFRFIRNLE
ncbi:MAG: glycosyltransferase family 2 protein [Candidatus Omnitrophica bacterium]|nr:glycosyltransferase family 2 protein [Candidatus Omnitrophota bacterium]